MTGPSFGATREEAVANLKEAVELFTGWRESGRLTVISDGLGRAAEPSVFGERSLFRCQRLPINVTVPTFVIPCEELRSRIATEVAVDARCIDIIPSRDILRSFIISSRHSLYFRMFRGKVSCERWLSKIH